MMWHLKSILVQLVLHVSIDNTQRFFFLCHHGSFFFLRHRTASRQNLAVEALKHEIRRAAERATTVVVLVPGAARAGTVGVRG